MAYVGNGEETCELYLPCFCCAAKMPVNEEKGVATQEKIIRGMPEVEGRTIGRLVLKGKREGREVFAGTMR